MIPLLHQLEDEYKLLCVKSWISGTAWVAFGDLNLRTLYQSELMTLTDQGYTKHYFIEGQRIASKLGTGFVGVEGADISEGQTPIYAESLSNRTFNRFFTKLLEPIVPTVSLHAEVLGDLSIREILSRY